jgi:hypothetical protein
MFTNSMSYAGPFGCTVPHFTPHFNPNFGPNFGPGNFSPAFSHGNHFDHSHPQHFAHSHTNPTTQTNWFAPSPFNTNYNNTPSPFGFSPAPWFANPTSYSNFDSTPATPSWNNAWNPSWNNTFNASSPFPSSPFPSSPWASSNFACNASNSYPNNGYNTPFSTPAFGWNQPQSFSPFAPSAPFNASPWFANPNFYQPTNTNFAHASTPWFAPAFAPAPWFAPHNWNNSPMNPAYAPSTHVNGTNPTPYAVATPPNANASRDAA